MPVEAGELGRVDGQASLRGGGGRTVVWREEAQEGAQPEARLRRDPPGEELPDLQHLPRRHPVEPAAAAAAGRRRAVVEAAGEDGVAQGGGGAAGAAAERVGNDGVAAAVAEEGRDAPPQAHLAPAPVGRLPGGGGSRGGGQGARSGEEACWVEG